MAKKLKRAFDDLTDEPCPVCLRLAASGQIQPRAVMPLPTFPALLREDGQKCCYDCQATDATMSLGNHPSFSPARLTVANERVEGLTMPLGMMEHFGMCQMGLILPSSLDDLDHHIDWLERHSIPPSACIHQFVIGTGTIDR